MIIDLTADIYTNAPSPPGDPAPSVTPRNRIDADGFALSSVALGTHQGTHIDAPSHIIKNAKTLSDIPIERFAVRAIMANLSHIAPGGEIVIADMAPIESQIRQGMGIILNTGWHTRIAKLDYFTNPPRISLPLAKWFAHKKIGLLGIDMPCPNVSDWRSVHKTLLGADVLIIEGLANLHALNAASFTFVALPLKLLDADGAPVRAIAITDEEELAPLRLPHYN